LRLKSDGADLKKHFDGFNLMERTWKSGLTASIQWSEHNKALLRLQSDGAGALLAVNGLNPTA